jgi:hypothetical protein
LRFQGDDGYDDAGQEREDHVPQIRSPERRRSPRVRAKLPMTLKARDAGSAAQLKDISNLGLCCTFPEPIPEMTLVKVRVEVDNTEHEIEGAVVRCEKEKGGGWEIAVYFTNMGEGARAGLTDFVATQVPNQMMK